MKYILILALSIIAFPVIAGGGHHHHQGEPGANGTNGVDGANGTNGVDGSTGLRGKTSPSSGVATSIAHSQLNFDWGTYALQGSCGYGNFDSKDALSCGLGRRFGKVLVSGSIGSENNTNKYSSGVGISWRF